MSLSLTPVNIRHAIGLWRVLILSRAFVVSFTFKQGVFYFRKPRTLQIGI